MTTLDDYAVKAGKRVCLFGRAKTGKTALAAQLARIWTLDWVDLEDGIKTALKPEVLPKEYWKNINIFRIPSLQSIPMGAETIMKIVKGTECMVCWEHGKVACMVCSKTPGAIINRICLNEYTPKRCLVIDSTTQLTADANFATNPVIRGATEPHNFVLDKDTGGKDFKYPMAVSFLLDRIFSTLQASECNVVVISHETMTERTKDTGHIVGAGQNQPSDNIEMLFPAAGSRNFSRNFGKYFDALMHVDVVNRKHIVSSSSTYSSNVQTGSRIGNIEDMKGQDGKTPLSSYDAFVKLMGGG